jgi:hypothetical protein
MYGAGYGVPQDERRDCVPLPRRSLPQQNLPIGDITPIVTASIWTPRTATAVAFGVSLGGFDMVACVRPTWGRATFLAGAYSDDQKYLASRSTVSHFRGIRKYFMRLVPALITHRSGSCGQEASWRLVKWRTNHGACIYPTSSKQTHSQWTVTGRAGYGRDNKCVGKEECKPVAVNAFAVQSSGVIWRGNRRPGGWYCGAAVLSM